MTHFKYFLDLVLIIGLSILFVLFFMSLSKQDSFQIKCNNKGGVYLRVENGYVCIKKDVIIEISGDSDEKE